MGTKHAASSANQNKQRLAIVFGLTALYLVTEVIGGLLTHSLALLADAGHMLTDVAGLGLALFAIRFAERPARPQRTYGYYRVEILAALTNAVVLIGISVYILYEAYERFRNPPEVASAPMLVVATIGLVVLLEGTPSDVNLTAVREAISNVTGVGHVHDLHVWTLTSGVNALSVHAARADGASHDEVLVAVHRCVTSNFKIAHATVQVETQGCADSETHL